MIFQSDLHRREHDERKADELIVGRKQAQDNVEAWRKRAKEAIDDGHYHTAAAIIHQINTLVTRWNLNGNDPNH